MSGSKPVLSSGEGPSIHHRCCRSVWNSRTVFLGRYRDRQAMPRCHAGPVRNETTASPPVLSGSYSQQRCHIKVASLTIGILKFQGKVQMSHDPHYVDQHLLPTQRIGAILNGGSPETTRSQYGLAICQPLMSGRMPHCRSLSLVLLMPGQNPL